MSSATIRMHLLNDQCDGHVISREHHTLVDLNVKRIITSGHEFAIQQILMRYQISRIKHQPTRQYMSCCHQHTRVESAGSLISVISGRATITAFRVSIEHQVDLTGFQIAACGDGRY